jgi:predicted house-cleaning noncanonical NTP pyrophosphatase (MazG superfamily)
VKETLKERGRFSSVSTDFDQIAAGLRHLYDRLVTIAPGETLGVIVQDQVPALIKGHLSNERRVAEEYRDALVLLEDQTGAISEKRISFRRWRSARRANEGALSCTSIDELPTVLRQPLALSAQRMKRAHFEWVWDGSFVHVVQADLIEEGNSGINPTTVYSETPTTESETLALKYFLPVSVEDTTTAKLRNHAIYRKHGFWQPTFYRMSNLTVLDRILRNEPDNDLESDLKQLTTRPLILRTACSQPSGPLLPRSSLLTSSKAATDWLYGNFAQGIKEKILDPTTICLVAHHFIPAKVAAFSTGTADKLDVYIESLWGIPEGLYYYPFDSYTVHTVGVRPDLIKNEDQERFETKAKLRYKSHFVAPDSTGDFVCHALAPPWDWKSTIGDAALLKRIAHFTRQLAQIEGHAVSLMWFVSCFSPSGPVDLVPWFHEPLAELPHESTFRRNARDEIISISTERDLAALETRADSEISTAGRLVLELSPVEDHAIRSESFATRVGIAAKRLDAVVILNGASLSHIYYVLARTGAEIVALNIGDARGRREVHEKLVRDKVPENVAAAGEIVHVASLGKEETLAALRIKLVEEAFEVRDASREELVGELADVLEVIDALTTAAGLKPAEVNRIRLQKAAKRGGFQDGIVLISTASGSHAKAQEPFLPAVEGGDSRVIHSEKAPPLERVRAGPADLRDAPGFLEFVQNGSVALTHPEWTIESPRRTPVPLNRVVDSITWSIDGQRRGATLRFRVKIRIGSTQLELPFEPEAEPTPQDDESQLF